MKSVVKLLSNINLFHNYMYNGRPLAGSYIKNKICQDIGKHWDYKPLYSFSYNKLQIQIEI